MVGESFPWWLWITHWFNFFLILLFRSGYEILMSHPKLYWNDEGEPGMAWPRVGDEERSTDFDKEAIEDDDLWAAEDEIDAPSALVSLPGRDAIGMGRRWHFWGAIGWTVCGVLYVGALFASGEWLRLVPTSVSILPQAWSDLLTYLQFEIARAEGYNALQQLTYFGVIFVLSPLMIVTGVRRPRSERTFPSGSPATGSSTGVSTSSGSSRSASFCSSTSPCSRGRSSESVSPDECSRERRGSSVNRPGTPRFSIRTRLRPGRGERIPLGSRLDRQRRRNGARSAT